MMFNMPLSMMYFPDAYTVEIVKTQDENAAYARNQMKAKSFLDTQSFLRHAYLGIVIEVGESFLLNAGLIQHIHVSGHLFEVGDLLPVDIAGAEQFLRQDDQTASVRVQTPRQRFS